MCRLAFIPPGTDPERKEVLELLSHLCSMQGKDGMGVGGWTPAQDGRLVKGVDAKPEEAVKKLAALDAIKRGVLFHCRAATSGGRVDALTQPFVFGDFMTVHNGHWTDWKEAFWPLVVNGGIKPSDGPINDSACAAALVGRLGHEAIRYIDSGVYITWRRSEKWPIVHVNRGDFAFSALPKKLGGGIIYASSFPYTWDVKVMELQNNTRAVLTPAGPHILYGEEPAERAYYVGTGYSRKGWKGHEHSMGTPLLGGHVS